MSTLLNKCYLVKVSAKGGRNAPNSVYVVCTHPLIKKMAFTFTNTFINVQPLFIEIACGSIFCSNYPLVGQKTLKNDVTVQSSNYFQFCKLSRGIA